MEVRLDKRYPLSVGVDAAWRVLSDVRAVAGCMPGAQITEQIDETHYKGVVKSKVGPAQLTFNGDIEVLALDAASRALEMLGKGADKSGSSASMKLAARVVAGESAGGSVLVGEATVTVSGKLAQFGGRLLVPVADAMLAQFALAFEANASALATPAPAPDPVAAPAQTVASTPGDAVAGVATPVPAGPMPAPVPVPVPPPRELDALGLAWAVVRSWWRGLFGKKTA